MPFRARDLVGTDILTVNTYPRAVDFPIKHRTGNDEYLEADIINLDDELKRCFNFIIYALIGRNTYMPCVQKRHYLSQTEYIVIITRIKVYDVAHEDGRKVMIDAGYLGYHAHVDIIDGVVRLGGAPAILHTRIDVIIEDITEMVIFIPSDGPGGLCSGRALAPGWTRTKVSRDEVCDMPDPDNWHLTTVRDWVHHHNCEHFKYALHMKLIEDKPYNLYKVTDAGMGYVEIEYL